MVDDGPFGRVEFGRQSNDGRLTLVLAEEADYVRLLWAQMDADTLDGARDALRAREGITVKDWTDLVGSWRLEAREPQLIAGLPAWTLAHGVEAVVWTALKPRFQSENRMPTAEEAVTYLGGLQGSRRTHAEQYIRCTPLQVDTAYRRRIEADLGWTYTPYGFTAR
jgi:hypothetical protein